MHSRKECGAQTLHDELEASGEPLPVPNFCHTFLGVRHRNTFTVHRLSRSVVWKNDIRMLLGTAERLVAMNSICLPGLALCEFFPSHNLLPL
jgi:hypothetical protein